MFKKIIYIAVVIVLLIGSALGIQWRRQKLVSKEPLSPTASGKKVSVVATFFPIAEFVKAVGGEQVSVSTLASPGTEPHDYEPTPQDMILLSQAQLFIYNGLGLEPWLNKIDGETLRSTKMVKVSDGVQTITRAGVALPDPHIWLSPIIAKQEVEIITRALVTVDPAHQSLYEQRSQSYQHELDRLDQDFRKGLANCHLHDIVTSHDAFAYLAQEYGLRVVPIAGLSPDEEPSPQKMGEVAQFVRQQGVRFIFFESLVSPKLSQTIAQETGAQVIAFNPLEGLTPAEVTQGKNYLSVQRENLAALQQALQCEVQK